MGVVSGLVMAYQFGTNWAGFSAFAGSVTGPLLAYEVLTAFFPRSGFSGSDAVRVEQGWPGAALCLDADGRRRHTGFCHMDPGLQQLDAYAARVRVNRWQSHSSGLVQDHL